MQIYLVGGAVRDQLLNLPIKDRDFLVVGATATELINQGYQQVGADFPVFLHPVTQQEYALARQERKSGTGYTGFVCDFSPNVTLEQDLIRRDLTINAMAQDLTSGQIFDPFGGKTDLANRLLRHISDAFAEDPLRVLRVARFAAHFHHLGFSIAEQTLELMQKMTACGELNHLTAERIWRETEKALHTESPHIYFQVLRKVNALAVLFPEIDQLFGQIQSTKYHLETDRGQHTLLALQQAKLLVKQAHNPTALLWAVLCHDLGKGLISAEMLPHHYQPDVTGIQLTHQLADRLKVPTAVKELALLVNKYHTDCHKIAELDSERVLELFNQLDVWRKPQRLDDFLLACEADARARLGAEYCSYLQATFAIDYFNAANAVNVQAIIADGFKKQAIRDELNHRRINIIKQIKNANLK
ncbi:multifunctional CCA addition/repair protein [[Haemophilus] ducreyi]|uniref:multifunctional CCA addition/repair protein n=1 Tax=Haemophilus ducreyi TaxID=730 RepID=UPI000655C318|nr:multifunctional CCA addition/repair protein [[Haemophilus] ducreyi]AKO45400.1 2', 3'-cyclic nucleotide 2'-phosphodiesterase [[Haemophilus] ducreyi]AKO46786.1 2', 3'-cyclic nucleotide 2'-phosphodiesterase [[Haemophilus] ducreyi]AKO48125.1 2', 3'-cyclic nucleotide 2'-phosphodiesterase [[Haemophilus] ducreyi]AKO49513.1 2', 3'-cyclic nucleotide 2'-phosphodiesterase [[Haemophilus] ducreyi]ANF61449.1 multifunctional CCA tRNA nucleotidyl transferase/2'3'-cyclic phosphodiesterase/2'nucleotidase/pho